MIFLAATAFYYLLMKNADVLFVAQLRSFFAATPQFFNECMARPGGLLQWGACWFTQLFYHPWLGTTALAALWCATFLVLKKAYGMPSVLSPLLLLPLACLLVSDIDMGYWVYYLKHPGYYYRESLGLLCVALLAWLSRADRFAALGSIVAAAVYPLVGFYSPVALAVILVTALVRRRWVAAAIALFCAVAAPLLWSKMYTTMRGDEVFTVGFPFFEWGELRFKAMETPLMAATALVVLLPLLRLVPQMKGKLRMAYGVIYLLVAGGIVLAAEKYNYSDACFTAECRAYRAIDEQRWDDALTEIRNVDEPATREMIMLRNIALINSGDLGTTIYGYDDRGAQPSGQNMPPVHTANTIGPLYYLNHGMANFAHRWCMESLVEYGPRVSELKVLALASMVMEDYDAAEKYLDMLSATTFYGSWADHYRPILQNHKRLAKYPDLKHYTTLYRYVLPMAGTDAGLPERYVIDYFSNLIVKDSKPVQEMCLAYAMMSKKIQRYWPQYLTYLSLHPGETVPRYYQETAFLYGMLEPQTAPSPKAYGMVFDQERVAQPCIKFYEEAKRLAAGGMTNDAIGANMAPAYGDTFWWAYFFNTESVYY